MIITCPACHTRFQLPPTSLGASGRNVRCSSCGERWFLEPFTDAPPPPVLAQPVAEAASLPPPAGPATGRRLTPWLAGILVLLLAAAAILGRNQIAHHLPATAPVYQRLGLSLELPLGIEFRDLGSERRTEQGQQVLVVTGEITNISGQRREVPPIRVALLDADRRELDHGSFDPPEPALGPGVAARFEIELDAPPPEAKDFSVSFDVEPGE
jgi:predicted Zn finger-like uncharacterized protein